MNAETLRRLLADDELDRLAAAETRAQATAALLDMVHRLADAECAFEASVMERERIAAAVAGYLDNAKPSEEAGLGMLRLAKSEWTGRAEIALGIIRDFKKNFAPVERAAGDAAWKPQGSASLDVRVARALIRALRTILLREHQHAEDAVRGIAAVVRQQAFGEAVWEAAFRPLLSSHADTARALGASRQGALLHALAVSAAAKGEALCHDDAHRQLAFQLGAAGSRLLQRRPGETGTSMPISGAFHSAALELDRARLALWDGIGLEEVRRLGAAAMAAAGHDGQLSPQATKLRRSAIAFRLPEAWHERFSHFLAQDAAEELNTLAGSPRISEAEQLMAKALSETLYAHPSSGRLSFAEALGIPHAELETAPLRNGHRLFRAKVLGKHPTMILCTGTRGRTVRCRAVADEQGALVGYRAFDPLSREIGGKPLYALYGLDGLRAGYQWRHDGPAYAGTPPQTFVTAPERLNV